MKKVFATILCALAVQFSASLHASPLNIVDPFTISGPGSTSAAGGGGIWDLGYSLNPAGFSTVSWTVTGGPVSADGNYHFDWTYSGFHAFFSVTAFLTTSSGTTLVNVGPNNCCTAPSGGFSYNGRYGFMNVQAGDTIGFVMGGSNFDSNNTLSGNLHLEQVPAPGTLLVLALGLLALGGVRARKA